jgi:hypothetical protein
MVCSYLATSNGLGAVELKSSLTLFNPRASVVFSVQSWLGESEETKKNTSTPGYFSVGMACMTNPKMDKPRYKMNNQAHPQLV